MPGKTSREKLAGNFNESPTQIQRYIRLTCLTKPMLGYVDEKRIAFGAGVELFYLGPEEQDKLYRVMERLCVFPSLA